MLNQNIRPLRKRIVMIPENIKSLLHFVCLFGVCGFATVGSLVGFLSGGAGMFVSLFSLLCCINLWYLAIKKHKENK